MNFKTVMFILILCAISIHEVFPVTIQVDTLTVQIDTIPTSDPIKVTFFSDEHKKSPGEQEQITSLIGFLQEQKDHSYHILVEQASKINKLSASGYETLYTLDKHIAQAKPPMTHTRLDNIEIRHIAGPAMDILKHYDRLDYGMSYTDFDYYSDHKTDDGKKTIATITFQDILDEFDYLKKSLAGYYLNHTNQTLLDAYEYYIEISNRRCEELKHKISDNSIAVLEYARAQFAQKIDSFDLLEVRADDTAIRFRDIKNSFTHLFDLNLLKNILTSQSHNILVFAGADHTQRVIHMLGRLKATSIFQERNFIIKDVVKKDGGITHFETVLPIRGSQIVQGLSAQSKEIYSFSYRPIIGYTVMVAVLYYLVSVIVSEQSFYGHA